MREIEQLRESMRERKKVGYAAGTLGLALGLSTITILPFKTCQNYRAVEKVFRLSISLLAETAGFCQYGRYFFWYKTGGVPVSVH